MFNRLRAAWIWMRIVQRYQAKDYKTASLLADKYRDIAFNDAVFRALDATLDILNHKYTNARRKFSQLIGYLNNIDKIDGKYIMLYSEYYLCVIDDNGDCEDILLKALNIPASSRVKSCLPLMSPLEFGEHHI
jgi:hypothetical protein